MDQHTVTMTDTNGNKTVIVENGTFEEALAALDQHLFGATPAPVTQTPAPSKSWFTRDGMTISICGVKWHPLWGLLRNFW